MNKTTKTKANPLGDAVTQVDTMLDALESTAQELTTQIDVARDAAGILHDAIIEVERTWGNYDREEIENAIEELRSALEEAQIQGDNAREEALALQHGPVRVLEDALED